ncbi:MAG: tail fiber domain-containing protein [bacterium]|nr:tail fiber domain-containing protein [bacterium]
MKFFHNKKIILTFAAFAALFFFSKLVFAVWDGFPYDPGETLNPECLPSDIDCDVLPPLTSTNISDAVYDEVAWNGVTTIAPSKNALRDKIETLTAGSHDPVTLGTANGLSLATQVLSLALASTSTTGALSDTDWDTFNDKQAALVSGTSIKTINGASILAAGDLALAPALGADDNYVTDAEKIVIGNTSGTNTGDQTSIVGITGTIAQFNTALTDGDFATGGGTATGTNTGDQVLPDNLTDFVDQTPWTVFYSNGSGDVTELALGADGTFLKSNGATSAPTFATPAGSGDVSKVGTPVDNQIGVWTGDGTIEGTTGLTYNGINLLLTGDFGSTGSRITKGWFTDLEVTNPIVGSITGNAGTVTNGVYTTGAGTVYEVPLTFGDGLTRTGDDIDVDTIQNIAKLSNLTGNGFVKTSGGDGTLSIDTNTYLTSSTGVTSVSGTTDRITSTGGTTPAIDISATFEALLGKVADSLAQFASTTSLELKGVISDETGSGALVFANSPVFTTPNIGSATGSISGNAGTATALETPRNINGIAFDGTADITVAAAAGTLTGTNLNSSVVTSSLTTVGVLSAGSITSGFGAIDLGADNFTTTGIVSTDTLTLTNTGTLNGLDVLDATSESTIESAIDTLANLTSIQGQGVTFSGTSNISGTNTGDQTSIVGITGTIAQFNTALTDGDFATGGGTATGTNTGDQTSVSGNAGTATALQTARTIGGVSFDGTANITVASAIGGFTISGGNLALGVNDLTMTGSLGATGARLTKGWFTDLEVTNPIAGSITGNAATVTTNANLTGAITSIGNATSLGSFSSANLSGALTDETGTGVAVFGTAPTFTTSIISPLLIGGTGTTDDLVLRTTSGVGASGADMMFQVGNNGATEAMRILNSGNVGIGTTAPAGLLQVGEGSLDPLIMARTGQLIRAIHGTDASPVTTIGPTVEISRNHNLDSADCDGNENDLPCSSALMVTSYGQATTTMQTTAIRAVAVSVSDDPSGIDAFGISARGLVAEGNVGVGGGAYLEGVRTTTAGFANGAEISPWNLTSTDCTYSTTAFSQCIGIWVPSRGLAGSDTSVAMQVDDEGGSQFLYGIGFNPGAVKTTTIFDNSDSVNSIHIDGTHTYAFISTPTAGNVGIGTVTPTAVLQLKAGTASAGTAPLKFTSGTNLTAAEAGAVEWNGTDLFITQTTGPTRKTFAFLESPAFTTPDIGVASGTSLKLGDGTLAAPAFAFTSQPGLGIYRNAANTFGFSNGTNRILMDPTGSSSGYLSLGPRLIYFGSTDSGTDTQLNRISAGVLALGTGAANNTDGTLATSTILGGTATTSDLNLKTTSGVGTTGADMHFLVGNNGATEAITILNSGSVGIGDATPDFLFDVAGTAGFDGLVTFVTPPTSAGQGGTGKFNEVWGLSASVHNSALSVNNTIIGNNASSTGTDMDGNVIIGASATTNFYNNVVIGSGASGTTSSGNVAIGQSASAINKATAIGYDATANGTGAVVLGGQSSSALGYGISIGDAVVTSTAGGWTGISIGNRITNAFRSIAIGGFQTNPTANSQLLIGSNTANDTHIADIYIGSGITDTAPVSNITYNGTGGSGTNIAGSSLTFAGGKGTGNAAGGSLVFSTSDALASGSTLQSLTEKARISAAGFFGIGDTSPDYKLELHDATTTPAFALSDDDIAHGVTTLAETDAFFHLSSISTTVGGAQFTGLADATGIALELKGVQSSDPTDATPAISLIGAKASGTGVVDLAAAETVLKIANNDDTAALTVLGSGNVGIGLTTPTRPLSFANATGEKISLYASSATARAYFGFGVESSILAYQVPSGSNHVWYTDSDERMRIDSVGGVSFTAEAGANANDYLCIATGTGAISSKATACTGSSSLRYKKNIEDLELGLDAVLAMRPVEFDWKEEYIINPNAPRQIGFIAEEMAEISPLFVTYENGIVEAVDYMKLTSVMAKAIQELNLNLEGISGTITPLEGSDSESFMTTFFENIYEKVGTWLADAGNGIVNIFAKEITTETLCVSDENGEKTCITKAELDALLSGAVGSSGGSGGSGGGNNTPEPTPEPDPEPAPESDTETTADEEVAPDPDSTPEVAEEPVPAPEPVPEPEVVSEPEPESESTPEPESVTPAE